MGSPILVSTSQQRACILPSTLKKESLCQQLAQTLSNYAKRHKSSARRQTIWNPPSLRVFHIRLTQSMEGIRCPELPPPVAIGPRTESPSSRCRTPHDADALTRNAAEQEKASANGGGAAGGGGATGGGGAATGGGTHSHGRDYLQETSDAIGWSKVPSFCWDVTDKVIEHINHGTRGLQPKPFQSGSQTAHQDQGSGHYRWSLQRVWSHRLSE